MTDHAQNARNAALRLEAKKDGLSQLQNGAWKLTLSVHPSDMPAAILSAAMGTRYVIAAVEVADDETPVLHTDEPKAETGKPKSKRDERKPSAQAGIRCEEPGFDVFLKEQYFANEDVIGESTANLLRNVFQIASRAQLNDPEFCDQWTAFDLEYQTWLNAPQHGAG